MNGLHSYEPIRSYFADKETRVIKIEMRDLKRKGRVMKIVQMDYVIWIEKGCDVSIPMEDVPRVFNYTYESFQIKNAPYDNMPETHPIVHALGSPSASTVPESASVIVDVCCPTGLEPPV
jgi:hypothetical protein